MTLSRAFQLDIPVLGLPGPGYAQKIMDALQAIDDGGAVSTRAYLADTTGVTEASTQLTAAAAAAEGGILKVDPGIYKINPETPWRVPNDIVIDMSEAALKMQDGVATENEIYRLLCPVVEGDDDNPPTNIVIIGGYLDGNRRSGNHGDGENVAGAWFSDAENFLWWRPHFYNFRSEGFYVGHGDGMPKDVYLVRPILEDLGFPEVGDGNTNPRQGVAFIAGTNLQVIDPIAKGIKGYAVDFEGNNAGVDLFDSPLVRGGFFEDCELGWVNVAPQVAADCVNGLVEGARGKGIPIGQTIVMKSTGGGIIGCIGVRSSQANGPLTVGFGSEGVVVANNWAKGTGVGATSAVVQLDNCTRSLVASNVLMGTSVDQGVREGGGAADHNVLGPNVIEKGTGDKYTVVGANTETVGPT